MCFGEFWDPVDFNVEVTSAGGQYKLGVHDDDIELTELGCPAEDKELGCPAAVAAVRVATTACGPARWA